MSPSELLLIYMALASAFTIAAAILSLVAKEDVYSALSLGLVGLGVAAIIALLGYGLLSVFHILVYVGATVTFVVFSVLLIGRGVGWEKKLLPAATATAALLALAYFASIYVLSTAQVRAVTLNLEEMGVELFARHVLSFVFLAFALASVMIEGLLIASKKGEK